MKHKTYPWIDMRILPVIIFSGCHVGFDWPWFLILKDCALSLFTIARDRIPEKQWRTKIEDIRLFLVSTDFWTVSSPSRDTHTHTYMDGPGIDGSWVYYPTRSSCFKHCTVLHEGRSIASQLAIYLLRCCVVPSHLRLVAPINLCCSTGTSNRKYSSEAMIHARQWDTKRYISVQEGEKTSPLCTKYRSPRTTSPTAEAW